MKTSRTPAVDRKSKRRDNRLVGGIIIGVAFFSASVFLGVQIERSHYETPLPANILCLNVAKETPKFYKAKIDEVFGIPTPKDSPTRDQLKKLIKDCEDNVQNYSITLEGK